MIRPASLALATLCALSAAPAMAQSADNYPVKPVRLLVGFAPGGANDLVARAVAARLSPRMGQQVVVENRAGAGGNLATGLAAKAAPDGYTLLLASVASFAMSPGLYKDLPFDPIKDFAPVTQVVGVSTLIALHPSMPFRSLKDYIAAAKKQPGKFNYASPGQGSISHLAAELFLHATDIKLTHVPYKGGGPAVIDVLAGQVECLISLISTGAPHVQSGKLRGLAVTSDKRSPILKDIPTVAESGYPGFEASGWLGLAFPAKTPQTIVDRVNRETTAVMNLNETRDQLQNAGLDIIVRGPAEFRTYMQSELVKWTKLIKDRNIAPE